MVLENMFTMPHKWLITPVLVSMLRRQHAMLAKNMHKSSDSIFQKSLKNHPASSGLQVVVLCTGFLCYGSNCALSCASSINKQSSHHMCAAFAHGLCCLSSVLWGSFFLFLFLLSFSFLLHLFILW